MGKQELQISDGRGNLWEERGRRSVTGGLMRTIWLTFILAGLVNCLCAGQANQGNSPAASTQSTREISNLVCSISPQKAEWEQPQAVEVGLAIENRLDSELNVSVVPSLTLTPLASAAEPQKSEPSYEALWDWDKGSTLPLSATVSLQLKPGSSKNVSSDIASLLWSGINGSALPHSTLFKIVPPGRYSLRLVLTGRHGKPLCSSNAVNVHIK